MSKILDNENLIDYIKNTDAKDLDNLAEELREELLNDVSANGGHLASNLGVVELTIALYKVFDFTKDKLVWDVGHQSYVSKIISGRKDALKKLRQPGGPSGFPKRSESPFDFYDSGHSSTSISAALGYALARDLNKDIYSCISVIGDGALNGGVAFEALNNAGSMQTPLIVILNDNQMSIGSSVGGTNKYSLNKLRASKFYLSFKSGLKKTKISAPGLYRFLKKVRDFLKYLFIPHQFFEDFGFKYYGPVDGHNIDDLCDAFEYAKKLSRPVLIHVITKKGKGFEPAELNPEKYHGVSAFNIQEATSEDDKFERSWSNIFGDELLKEAKTNNKIVAVSAAMVKATGLYKMQEEMPNRVFDVGIAEQHAVSMAAGMALNGYKPVVAVYSTFLQRAYDQILTEVCLQNLPVVFAIDRAGVTGSDGETHQGMFDISYLNSMPNMTVLNAYDEVSFRALIKYAISLNSPCAIRYGKTEVPEYKEYLRSAAPELRVIKEGRDMLILSDSLMLSEVLKASDLLSINSAVINVEKLKPLDVNTLLEHIRQFKVIVTVEDGCKIGGFGSEVSKLVSENIKECNVLNIAWPDKFIEHGSISYLRKKYGMNAEGIAKKAEDFFESKIR